jgi:hypothetical protein
VFGDQLLVVSSTFQVANLNASLLAGQPATNFATLGSANTFAGGITANSFTGTYVLEEAEVSLKNHKELRKASR